MIYTYMGAIFGAIGTGILLVVGVTERKLWLLAFAAISAVLTVLLLMATINRIPA